MKFYSTNNKDLNEVLDYENYDTEIYDYFNLQVGYSSANDDCFIIPKNHVDFGYFNQNISRKSHDD